MTLLIRGGISTSKKTVKKDKYPSKAMRTPPPPKNYTKHVF
jgi:hypothetical protein